MALEIRDGRPYYYRKVREGSRVRSEYVASGRAALILAAVDEERRKIGRLRPTPKEELDTAGLIADVEAYCDEVTAAMREHLQAAGYHRLKRGAWRKARR